jgi:hypothetical protein
MMIYYHVIGLRFSGAKSALVEGPANLVVIVYTGCTLTLISEGWGGGELLMGSC